MLGLEEVVLTLEEFEAIRLTDLLDLKQDVAAKKMDVSQPTFHRVLLSARKKIADSLVNGKAIKIEGGTYVFKNKIFEEKLGGYCVCPKCEYRVKHKRGVPCSTIKCPKCGASMVRNI